MINSQPTIFVVAGDPAARRALVAHVKRLRLPATACRSADEFLEACDSGTPGCVLLDVSPPAVDVELLQRLRQQPTHLPVIAVSSRAEVPTAVRVMKLGAADFLESDCLEEQFGDAVREALCREAQDRRRVAQADNFRRRLARLAPGAREVLDRLLAGKTNREIAAELELSVRSIEVRRAKIMRVMQARSFAGLVRMVAACGQPSAEPSR